MNFENAQIFPENLPKIKDLELHGLERSYLNVLYLFRSIFSLVFLVIPSVLYFSIRPEIELWIVGLVYLIWIMICIIPLLLTKKAFLQKKYAIRHKDILFQSGLIYRQLTVIPFNRIQHIEIKNGPLDRMFGLAGLKIYTAGGSQSDLSIPGLEQQRAEEIKEFIIGKNFSDEEE